MEKAEATKEFEVQKKGGLIDDLDLTLNDSTELLLIQWPVNLNQALDFDGQEVTLKLHHNGELGSFEGSSGKSYDIVSLKSQDQEGKVFLPSASDTKYVGKISRRVSLVHYMDPAEFEKQDKVSARAIAQRSTATSLTNSARRTPAPTQTIRPRNFQTSAGTASTPSSRIRGSRSSISGALESAKTPKRKRVDEPTSSAGGQSDRDSGKAHSNVTSTESYSRKKIKKEKE